MIRYKQRLDWMQEDPDGDWVMHQDAQESEAERARLQQWVHDLQSGMYINCVYCGHRYGPRDEVPATMADALKEHIEQCPKHPMSALKAEVARLQECMNRAGLECFMREGTPEQVAEHMRNVAKSWVGSQHRREGT